METNWVPPRLVLTQQGTALWNWSGEAFGNSPANEDADGDGVAFAYNLRFPGQYYDQETRTHYNHFRDYDPSTGRYVQADPIGFLGGVNPYSYVRANPLAWSDSWGLRPLTPQEKTLLGPYIPQTDLDNADVHVGEKSRPHSFGQNFREDKWSLAA